METLTGVGRKVADCIALFSMDQPQTIPVDTHVFQIAQRFGFVKGAKSQSNLNEKLYHQIGDSFRDVYGPHAGWAHQILFAGDLNQFKEKVAESKKRPYDEFKATNDVKEEKTTNKKIKR